MSAPRFSRVVVKLSGEALMGGGQHGLDAGTLERIAADVKGAAALGAQVAVVVGGGNFFRGLAGTGRGIDRIGSVRVVMNLSQNSDYVYAPKPKNQCFLANRYSQCSSGTSCPGRC